MFIFFSIFLSICSTFLNFWGFFLQLFSLLYQLLAGWVCIPTERMVEQTWRWSIETCHLPRPGDDPTNMSQYFASVLFENRRVRLLKWAQLENGSSKVIKNLRRRNVDSEILSIVSLLRWGGCLHPNSLLTVTKPFPHYPRPRHRWEDPRWNHRHVQLFSTVLCWTKRSWESPCVAPSAWKSYWPSLPSLFASDTRLDNNSQMSTNCWQNINQM